jgi:hypothetical protein
MFVDPPFQQDEVYRLERIYGRPDTHYFYVSQPMTLDEAVQMLIQKYWKW